MVENDDLRAQLDKSDLSVVLKLEKLTERTFEMNEELSDWNDFRGNLACFIKDSRIIGICINNMKLSAFPTPVLELCKLDFLILENNNIQFIPEEIEKLGCLKTLCLNSNRLIELPSSLFSVRTLEALLINNNRLFELPDFFDKLSLLKRFCCDDNFLKKIPKSITKLKFLLSLQLEANQLYSLPNSIGNLTSLENLDIGTNKLRSLPYSFINLKNLTFVNIEHNPFILNKEKSSLLILNSLYSQNPEISFNNVKVDEIVSFGMNRHGIDKSLRCKNERLIVDLLENKKLTAYKISQESKININDVHSYLNQLHEQCKIEVLTSYKPFRYKKILEIPRGAHLFVEIPADLTKVNMKNRTIRLLLQKTHPLITLELELKNNLLIVNTGWVDLDYWSYPISMTIQDKIRPYRYKINQLDWKNL